MNIDLLSKMIKELILDNDCVALPGFGAFIAEIVPASFSDKGYTLNPPYRRLHFRAREIQDNALATLYAASNNIGLEMAQAIVQDFIAELKKVLQKEKVVIFPGLGRLRATKENNFFFVPDEDLDIYPDGFGLEAISLKTHQETDEEVAAAVGDLVGIIKDMPETTAKVPEADVHAERPDRNEADEVSFSTAREPEVSKVDSAETSLPEKPAVTGQGRRKAFRIALITTGVIAGVLALVLIAFLVVAEAWPDFMDSILYNKEEREILKNWEHI